MKKISIFLIAALSLAAVSCNKDNTTGGGKDNDKDTPAIAGAPTVETREASLVAANSATISGEIMDEGDGTLLLCGFVFSDSNKKPNVDNSERIDLTIKNASFSTSLSGLEPATTYYFRAFALNTCGIAYGETMSFKTVDVSVLYVRSDGDDSATGESWLKAKATLGAAMKIAETNTQIWMKTGDYSSDETHLKDGVSIIGGFAGNEKSLSDRPGNSYSILRDHKIFCDSDMQSAVLLQGLQFSLTNSSDLSAGKLEIGKNVVADDIIIKGGPLLYMKGGTVRNSVVRDGYEYRITFSAPSVFINSKVIGNSLELAEGLFSFATPSGTEHSIISNCLIKDNYFRLDYKADASVSLFAQYYKTAEYYYITADITNCTIVNNYGEYWKSTYWYNHYVELCQYQNQEANFFNNVVIPGTLSKFETDFNIKNCAFSADYNGWSGGDTEGLVNLSKDGVNADFNEDYSLGEDSALRNAGNSAYLPSVVTLDLAGNKRVCGSSVDIGAFEYQE